MKKTFDLPLLAALPALLPALLSSCGPDQGKQVDTSGMSRQAFKTEAECRAYYKLQIEQGLQNPCNREQRAGGGGFIYFGPWFGSMGSISSRGGFNSGSPTPGTTSGPIPSQGTRYVGYTPSGKVSTTGLTINPNGRASSYTAPTISRGGFSTGARGWGGSSGS